MKKFCKVFISGIAESGLHTLPTIMFAFSGFIIHDINGETNLWAMLLFATACVFIALGIFLILMIGVQYADYMELRKERDISFNKKYGKCIKSIIIEVNDGVFNRR